MELQQVIYNLLKTQIQFGVHRYGDSLPTIKEASKYFMASIDTVRLAYLRLKQEEYINLGPCVGATVKVRYSDQEIKQHIHDFFSFRRNTLTDLAFSTYPLFCHAQFLALKSLSSETLDQIEYICSLKEISPPYRMSQHLLLIYGSLGNELFMRLIWQMFLFFQAPFLSIPKNMAYFESGDSPILEMVRLCRKKDWHKLQTAVDAYHQQLICALNRFYNEAFPAEYSKDTVQIGFSWNIYKKSSQICYSLGMELLQAVRYGVYPVGSFLPAPSELAKEKKVSVNTIRRTIALLNKIGATQSINGVGTKVLLSLTSPQNSDVTDTAIQKRLLDFSQCIHILAMSCRTSAYMTITSMDAASIRQCLERLEEVERIGRYEIMVYTCFEFIALFAPYQAVRTVYAELIRQLFWGYPLHNLHGGRESTNAFYDPYLKALKDCLNRADAAGFSEKLEELQWIETQYTVNRLIHLGINEASSIVIPQ